MPPPQTSISPSPAPVTMLSSFDGKEGSKVTHRIKVSSHLTLRQGDCLG